jgi:hypothetical protein
MYKEGKIVFFFCHSKVENLGISKIANYALGAVWYHPIFQNKLEEKNMLNDIEIRYKSNKKRGQLSSIILMEDLIFQKRVRVFMF